MPVALRHSPGGWLYSHVFVSIRCKAAGMASVSALREHGQGAAVVWWLPVSLELHIRC